MSDYPSHRFMKTTSDQIEKMALNPAGSRVVEAMWACADSEMRKTIAGVRLFGFFEKIIPIIGDDQTSRQIKYCRMNQPNNPLISLTPDIDKQRACCEREHIRQNDLEEL